jgi:hypothetical protein
MTTAATIEQYRQKAIAKMVSRLVRCGLVVIDDKSGTFQIYGEGQDADSGIIAAPCGKPVWTVPQLLGLLDQIATHGRSTNYRVRFRNQFRTWGGTLTVPAGRIPLDEAARHAEMNNAELLECMKTE